MINTITQSTTNIPELAYRTNVWESNPMQLQLGGATASEAIKYAGLDYEIIKEPLMIHRTGEITDSYAIGREVVYSTGETEFINF